MCECPLEKTAASGEFWLVRSGDTGFDVAPGPGGKVVFEAEDGDPFPEVHPAASARITSASTSPARPDDLIGHGYDAERVLYLRRPGVSDGVQKIIMCERKNKIVVFFTLWKFFFGKKQHLSAPTRPPSGRGRMRNP